VENSSAEQKRIARGSKGIEDEHEHEDEHEDEDEDEDEHEHEYELGPLILLRRTKPTNMLE